MGAEDAFHRRGDAHAARFPHTPNRHARVRRLDDHRHPFGIQFLNGSTFLSHQDVTLCYQRYQDFSELTTSMVEALNSDTPGSEQQAVDMMAQMFYDFYPLNEQCIAGLNTMIAVFDRYTKIFSKPLEIFFNTIYNYRAIFRLMTEGVGCAFALDMECLGYNSGVMFYKILYVKR